jgi:hypothetical protein
MRHYQLLQGSVCHQCDVSRMVSRSHEQENEGNTYEHHHIDVCSCGKDHRPRMGMVNTKGRKGEKSESWTLAKRFLLEPLVVYELCMIWRELGTTTAAGPGTGERGRSNWLEKCWAECITHAVRVRAAATGGSGEMKGTKAQGAVALRRHECRKVGDSSSKSRRSNQPLASMA